MTTGCEGGMATISDEALLWAWKDHSNSWKAVYESEYPPGFRWLHESFGTQHEIVASGVPCVSGSCSEDYREKAFDDKEWRPEKPLPVARELGEASLMHIYHPTLTEAEIDKTCDVLREVMDEATGHNAR
ncbi:hypothetical protein [Halomonas sp. HG01]|uniref:hypothetical protein n=1 Tax=Halomonas sp. HG01 TaxID=1609967 RepID=UPI000697A764